MLLSLEKEGVYNKYQSFKRFDQEDDDGLFEYLKKLKLKWCNWFSMSPETLEDTSSYSVIKSCRKISFRGLKTICAIKEHIFNCHQSSFPSSKWKWFQLLSANVNFFEFYYNQVVFCYMDLMIFVKVLKY